MDAAETHRPSLKDPPKSIEESYRVTLGSAAVAEDFRASAQLSADFGGFD